jgi:5-methylcytosine-specific restriction protein A
MPLHRCGSCLRLVDGRCPHCRQQREASRPNANARGYTSMRWRALRLEQLRAQPFCSVCQRVATDVDHLERHTGPTDPRFWDPLNLDSKCHACHSRKTATQDSTFAGRS